MKHINKFFILLLCASALFFSCSKTKFYNDTKDARLSDSRSVTIINKTGEKLIKECLLETASGVRIASQSLIKDAETIVFQNYDGAGAFSKDDALKVILVDRYDNVYEKEFAPNKKGNTDVEVQKKDKKKGSLWQDIEKMLN